MTLTLDNLGGILHPNLTIVGMLKISLGCFYLVLRLLSSHYSNIGTIVNNVKIYLLTPGNLDLSPFDKKCVSRLCTLQVNVPTKYSKPSCSHSKVDVWIHRQINKQTGLNAILCIIIIIGVCDKVTTAQS